MNDWLTPLAMVATALATYFLPRLADAWGLRSTAQAQAKLAHDQRADSTALTREDKLALRVSALETQVALQAQARLDSERVWAQLLLDSERVRARQEAQLADVCAERDGYRTQYHDLAVVVQREEAAVSSRILAGYQAMQITRSAPTSPTDPLKGAV